MNRRSWQMAMWMMAVLSTGAFAQSGGETRMPAQGAKEVCPDTHLHLTFSSAPVLGKAGVIKIFDAADDKLVDTVDVGVPTTQQNYVIGGSPLHAYPVIISGNTAVIYPHNQALTYGKTYYVQIDPGVVTVGGAAFGGISGKDGWKFSTRAAAPAAGVERVVVSADGTGDFATVQGAVDFVPANNAKRLTIFLKRGTYTEMVCFLAKNNITFLGEDREKTIVQYANYNNLQPNNAAAAGQQFSGSSYRRGVIMGLNSSGVVLANFTVHNINESGSQSEAVLFKENRGQTGPNQTQVILTHMSLYSHIDTLQVTGKAYITDTYIEGDGDYMWGDGPVFFTHSKFHGLKNGSAFTQPRNPATHHGFVFVDSTFDGAEGVTRAVLGNGGANSETVLINCALGTMVAPNGWNSQGANNAEFNLTNLSDGKPYDTSKWPAWVKHWDKEKDAATIANYRTPSWVLGGWSPELSPLILRQPEGVTAGAGQVVTLKVEAAGIPTATYQWERNGVAVKAGEGVTGEGTDTLTLAHAGPGDAGAYAVKVTNAAGSAVSAAATVTVK